MDGNQPARLSVMAKLVLALAVLSIVAGAVWHGVTLATFGRIWRDIFDRPEGPMSFRFIVQPTMATIAALRDGIKDARTGRTPYSWAILHDPQKRVGRLDEALVATGQIVLIGFVMDTIYQIRVFKTFFPFEALIVSIMLAFVPYVLLRGPIARVARWRTKSA